MKLRLNYDQVAHKMFEIIIFIREYFKTYLKLFVIFNKATL
jgi:hypothetical protein